MRVFKMAEVVANEIIMLGPNRGFRSGDLAAILTNLDTANAPEPGPTWSMTLEIGDGPSLRMISIELAPFLSAQDYAASFVEPLLFVEPRVETETYPFLFRDRFFLTERAPRTPAEREEVVLRIKKAVYDEKNEIVALRSAVANIEAALEYQVSGPRREPIPDDVKLLVWSRDGGRCVRCGSNDKLHFDHVIPVVKGGGNDENNIQLLCRLCNLRKSDRIAF